MNLDKLKPTWEQFKVINAMDEMDETEILSCIEPKKQVYYFKIPKRIAQNALIFSFLIMTLSGGCSI